jgi:cytochrome c oxidase subunit 1
MNGVSLNLNSKADPTLLDNLKIWIIVAVILIVIAYALPFSEIYSNIRMDSSLSYFIK